MTTDHQHTRPHDVDDLTVEALGNISEALDVPGQDVGSGEPG